MDAVTAKPFSAEDFKLRAARQSVFEPGTDYGDHRLNPDLRDMIVRPNLRDAAVLIPVVDHGGDANVLLTKRTEKMRSHSGQIAFPGGAIDPTDASPEDAAVRETLEEIGLGAADIDVVGRMPDYVTGSGYRIVPVFGIVRPDYLLTINRDEVDDAFEVPLSFLMDPANHRRESRVWQDKERFYYTMPFGERYIWGVTAGIIRTLYERLYA
ncbi:NUDIX domain-containing protein [Mesorhizobium albiziae]|uniref:NUDIX domain-containing protein n=1 Tax=Neomesorhizobium albiziae TaxID=335020 RepID=A0A1I3Z942_9HYPH|nr:CoA pyrophosphatase [Mesorhizobium albiziae]GLS32087.1 coenzyme A pyrophosphatase [Mesorhizobium albiziae]SFK40668.1 NUDIX domain-containing protein [Mesorhizobium albiziae]